MKYQIEGHFITKHLINAQLIVYSDSRHTT